VRGDVVLYVGLFVFFWTAYVILEVI